MQVTQDQLHVLEQFLAADLSATALERCCKCHQIKMIRLKSESHDRPRKLGLHNSNETTIPFSLWQEDLGAHMVH